MRNLTFARAPRSAANMIAGAGPPGCFGECDFACLGDFRSLGSQNLRNIGGLYTGDRFAPARGRSSCRRTSLYAKFLNFVCRLQLSELCLCGIKTLTAFYSVIFGR